MTLWELILMGKEAHKHHDNGLINVSAIEPSVLLTERAFTEIFPVGWNDGAPFLSCDGKTMVKTRSIKVDGVEFKCVVNVNDDT